jgi:FkbM family methyltransferase
VNLSLFRRSFEAELDSGTVKLVPAAAWDRDGEIGFNLSHFRPAHDSARGQVAEAGGEVRVRALTIDSLVRQLGLEAVDLIKMDIEGGERKALLGASETIRRFRPQLAVAAYHLPDDSEVIPGMVLSLEPEYQYQLREGVGLFVIESRP